MQLFNICSISYIVNIHITFTTIWIVVEYELLKQSILLFLLVFLFQFMCTIYIKKYNSCLVMHFVMHSFSASKCTCTMLQINIDYWAVFFLTLSNSKYKKALQWMNIILRCITQGCIYYPFLNLYSSDSLSYEFVCFSHSFNPRSLQ